MTKYESLNYSFFSFGLLFLISIESVEKKVKNNLKGDGEFALKRGRREGRN
jgi:hypothetical protein